MITEHKEIVRTNKNCELRLGIASWDDGNGTCNIRKSNKIPKMEYIKIIQTRNDKLRKLNTSFIQNQFKTYKPQLISDMWKYAQSGGFVVML